MLFENSDLNIYCPECKKNMRVSSESWEQSKACIRCGSLEARHVGYFGFRGVVMKGWRGFMDDSKPDGGIPWGEVPGDDTDPDNPANKEN